MEMLIGIGVLINKKTFEGGHLFERGTYWKEGVNLNHYGKFYLSYNYALSAC